MKCAFSLGIESDLTTCQSDYLEQGVGDRNLLPVRDHPFNLEGGGAMVFWGIFFSVSKCL